MTSSCCPAFVKLIKKHLPDVADKISETDSPMIATGRLLKKMFPYAVTVFIGPCIAKKGEADSFAEIDAAAARIEELENELKSKIRFYNQYKEQFNKPKEREFQIGDVIKCNGLPCSR